MSNKVGKTDSRTASVAKTRQPAQNVGQMQSAAENDAQLQKPSLDVETLALVKKTAARLLDDADFVSEYVLSRDDVRRAVIDDYLKSFVRHSPSMPAGTGALAPPLGAKSLEEAKKLCELFLSAR